MRTWQSAAIIYPDAELTIISATRYLMADLALTHPELAVAHIGNQRPANVTTAIIWNRVGGADPNAILQCRVHAPTAQQATDLARHLAARLRLVPKMAPGIAAVTQNEGPTDLGNNPGPMRQMMYELALRGQLN